MAKGRGKARREKRREKRKPKVTFIKTTPTKTPSKKIVKDSKLVRGQKQINDKSNLDNAGPNRKKTKTGKGIIKEKVTEKIKGKTEMELSEARTIESMGGTQQERQVKSYKEAQLSAQESLTKQEDPKEKALQAQKNVQAREAKAPSKDQEKVEKLKVVNKILIGGIVTLATMGIGAYVAGGAAAGIAATSRSVFTGGRIAVKGTKMALHGTKIVRGSSGFMKGVLNPATKTALQKGGMPLVKRILAGGTKKLIIKGAVGIAGTDGIMAWLASDNILTGTVMYSNTIMDAVAFSGLPPAEGIARMQELKSTANNAANFVRISSKVNPALWLFGKPLMTNANQAKSQLEFNEEILRRQLTGGN